MATAGEMMRMNACVWFVNISAQVNGDLLRSDEEYERMLHDVQYSARKWNDHIKLE